MKKFLMVTTIQDTVEAFLIPHIKMLENEGYEVVIATNIYKDIPKDLGKNRWINIPFSRNPFSLNSFKAIKEMRKVIKSGNFEIVHFHTPVAAFLGRYAAMREKQKNIIYTAHGFHFFKGAPIQNWCIYYPMELIAARWTDKLLTINEEDYRNSLKFKLRGNGKCYKVNGVGVDPQKFKKENISLTDLTNKLRTTEEEFIILTLAELNENKNQIQILKALKEILEENKNIKYFMAGKGPNKQKLKRYILENNLEKNIFLLGQIEKSLIPELLQLSDLVISTSKREGLGLNIIEAIATKKNVLATENRGHKEIITNNNFLVEINNSEKLKNKILDIYIKKLNGIHNVNRFYLNAVLEKMREIYGEK
ncbi:glycosyltransferase [Cetobacterium somerae]|uniref:glycosyltransferase n=1 Tax=Cetobacterium somerae TaxID=188913 RepID=UPI00211F2B29|nr:glycosyltransferase [Cetobacterium somerae]MCQ9626467.1 glycosyltransferase [Cetobacterium somerae]